MINSLEKNIFVFWESNKARPGYLDACLETWYKSIKNLKVHILNYSNLKSYIGDVYDIEKLKKISLPKQSDAVSVAVLEKFGGLFIDMDTIITKNIFNFFENFDPQKLIFFGYPPNRGVHIAVMYVGKPGNRILTEWRSQCQYKLDNLELDNLWNSFGNAIIEPMLKDEANKELFHVIDCVSSGNLLERALVGLDPRKQYEVFYFSEKLKIDSEYFSQFPRDGMISLHNSWTPDKYKNMNKDDFLKEPIPLAAILNQVKFGREIKFLKHLSSLIYFEFYGSEFFKTVRLIESKKIVVADFVLNKCSIGFDLKSTDNNSDKVSIEIVARNDVTKEALGKKFAFSEGKNKILLEVCSPSLIGLTLREYLKSIAEIN